MTTCTVGMKPRAETYQIGPALGEGGSCMMVDREPVDCPGPKARILDGGIRRTWKAVIARPMLLPGVPVAPCERDREDGRSCGEFERETDKLAWN